MTTKKERIQQLMSKILQARIAYYNELPIVSDKIFDAWIDELKELDPTNKFIKMVGAPLPATTEWKKASHSIPMGSLNKVNTPKELIAWIKKVWFKIAPQTSDIFVAEKLDGISIELLYENGILIQAITRGDGLFGEDITKNVKKMGGVAHKLPIEFTGSLRGEIILTKSNYIKYFPDKANPRNAASGTSKRLDGINVEKLDILFYQALGNIEFETEEEQFVWLESLVLNTPSYWVFDTPEEVNIHWRKYQDTNRSKLNYDIDGLVISVNNIQAQVSLGIEDMLPVGAIAFKFENETKESTIRDIIWQVGNSGRITPVAIIDPVTLVGAKVTRASVYNIAYINELQLDVGATVLVARANDVIPRIEELIKGTGKVIKPPVLCPSCNSLLSMSGESLTCSNRKCPDQVTGRIKNWIKELNILEWGETTISKLVQSGKVNDIGDLYTLSVEDISSIDRMGQKSAQNCYNTLWGNTDIPLNIFIGGLSIAMIGSDIVKSVMKAGYDTLKKMKNAKVEDLETISGIGPTRANALISGIATNEELIDKILANGVTIKGKIMGNLTGKSICFTSATVPMKHKRAVLEQWAIEAGADVKSSVGKNLTYLVTTDPNSTSNKAVAARKFGTDLISEDEFLRMVGHEND